MLDRNGMARGVLIQPSFLGTDNGYMVSALRSAPERLRGIAVLAPEAETAALRDLAEQGVVGLRLNLIGRPDPDFAGAVWRAHLARVADLGWQIEVQAEARRLARLLPPLVEAGVPVVVDHFGRIDPALGIADPGFADLLGFGRGGRVSGQAVGRLPHRQRRDRPADGAARPPSACAAPSGRGACSGAATGRTRSSRPRPAPPRPGATSTPGCRTRPSAGSSWPRAPAELFRFDR